MAQFVDQQRQKSGRLANALFHRKFGSWPNGLNSAPIEPDLAFRKYEQSRRIAFAKRKRA
jgi:hypothetical protein